EYLQTHFPTLSYECSVENGPLGTGGAIQLALSKTKNKNIVITNGDTLYKVDIAQASLFHARQNAECTLLLKPMKYFDRYGVVETDSAHLIKQFREKQFFSHGNINGGIYLLNTEKFSEEELPSRFSFETDYLEKFCRQRKIYGQIQDRYFIDIGIPEDFNRAQMEFSQPPLDLKTIDTTWTLFLDRDGVINEDKPGGYILNPDEFRFLHGSPGLFKALSKKFGRLIIITNQRGLGRGLMSENDLLRIHEKMRDEIIKAGGNIDSIYFSPATDKNDPMRKPNPGMAFRAKTDFPEINFSRSIMAGNKLSDMHFGKHAGMYTVFIPTTNPETAFPHPDIDMRFDSLNDFVNAL
ncbi:MAG: HAD-IIIA family hydrolase, partial [Chitinophagaceae bacterium]